tara:strand:+ start:2007 stop:2744 length:738 start_codon:yes stop_codon:yes gene_type:complete
MGRKWTPEQRAAQAQRMKELRANGGAGPQPKAVEAAVDDLMPEPSTGGPSLNDVFDLVKSTAETVGGLDTRIAEVEARVAKGMPSYKPMVTDTKAPSRDRSVAVLEVNASDGQVSEKTITKKVLSTARGAVMTEGMMRLNSRNQFEVGDSIRLNPDVQPEGATKWEEKERPTIDGRRIEKYRVPTDEPRFWSDILGASPSDGTGEVLEVMYLSDKTGQWKYRCLIPGENTGKGGSGYWGYELLPA